MNYKCLNVAVNLFATSSFFLHLRKKVRLGLMKMHFSIGPRYMKISDDFSVDIQQSFASRYQTIYFGFTF